MSEPENWIESEEEEEHLRAQTEIEFCEFYHKVIGKLLGQGDYAENVKQAKRHFSLLRSVATRWYRFDEKADGDQLKQLKDELYYRIAFLFRVSTCVSGAAAHHFGRIVCRNSNALKPLLQRRVLRICSVGGGSPSDVVALLKVLERSLYVEEDVEVQISIIDGDKDWKPIFKTFFRTLDLTGLKVRKVHFVHADLAGPFRGKVTSAIAHADIVSVVKFLSDLDFKKKELKRSIFQKVHRLVQPGALTFLLDHPEKGITMAGGGHSGQLEGHQLLYEADFELYTLHPSVVERHFRLYSKDFGSDICNSVFNVFCRAWLKFNEADSTLPMAAPLRTSGGLRIEAEAVLEAKKARLGQLRSVCSHLGKSKRAQLFSWRGCFVREMEHLGCSEKKRRKTIAIAEKDPAHRLRLGKQLVHLLVQECREDEARIQWDKKKSDDNHKKGWIWNISKNKEMAESARRVYLQSIGELVKSLKQNAH